MAISCVIGALSLVVLSSMTLRNSLVGRHLILWNTVVGVFYVAAVAVFWRVPYEELVRSGVVHARAADATVVELEATVVDVRPYAHITYEDASRECTSVIQLEEREGSGPLTEIGDVVRVFAYGAACTRVVQQRGIGAEAWILLLAMTLLVLGGVSHLYRALPIRRRSKAMAKYADVLTKVATNWRRMDLLAGVSLPTDAVEATLRDIGVHDLEHLTAYFQRVGGMQRDTWDDDLLSFWPWDKVMEEWNADESDFLLFCDWSLNAHVYGISTRRSAARGVFEVCSSPPVLVAESFPEFLHLYLEDPERLVALRR